MSVGRHAHLIILGVTVLICEKLSANARLSKACSLAANGKALHGSLLLGQTEGWSIGLGDVLGLLHTVELDVAVAGKVGADATVGAVSATAARDGTLHNDVGDHAIVDVKLLGLGVSSEVDEKLTDALEGLLGPATLGVLEGLSLGGTADATAVLSERNNLLVCEAPGHVFDGLLELPALDGASDLVSVFVVGAEITNSALSGYNDKKGARVRHHEIEGKGPESAAQKD